MKIFKTLFALGILLVSMQAVIAETVQTGVSTTSSVACTMDAKLCPDGVTYVGRVAPSCNFAACPIAGDVPPVMPSQCLDLKNNLYLRSTDAATGGEVSALQDYLSPKYFNQEPTGYFGNVTLRAVQAFQRDNGILAAGYVGPVTRAKIKELSCAGTSQTLSINSISPSFAKVGQTVALSGSGLNSGGDYVLFNGWRIETDGSKALNRVAFVVPQYISQTVNCIMAPCPDVLTMVNPGTYTVQVVNNLGKTNTVNLTVTDGTVVPPVNMTKISFLEPRAAKVGTSVIIYGYNLFRPETRILFDGVSIPGTPVYSKRAGNFNSALEFTVPAYFPKDHRRCFFTGNALYCTSSSTEKRIIPGTYELTVDNKLGHDTVKFEVLADSVVVGKPYLSSLAPSQGLIGTEVIIYGQNLNTGSETVYFGGSSVSSTWLTTDSRGMIRFRVPEYITPCGYEDNTACRMMAQQVFPGKYDVVVKNKDGISNVLSFSVISGQTSVPRVTSLSPASGIVGTYVTVYGSNIDMGNEYVLFDGYRIETDGSKVAGQRSFYVPSYLAHRCVQLKPTDPCPASAVRQVTPGNYSVAIGNTNGVSNNLNFTVTSGTTNPPTISGVSGPQTLNVNQQGTWTVTASNPSGGNLSYSVVWGDEGTGVGSSNVSTQTTSQQTATFTHSYSQSGVYTPRFTVTNANGQSATAGLSVNVGSTTSQSPIVSSIYPSSVSVGTEVTITGQRLNTGNARVIFGNGYIIPDATRSSDSVLVFTVPSSMPRYCSPSIEMACTDDMISVTSGSYQVSVVNSFGTSNAQTVTVTSSTSNTPFISNISPSYGGTGSSVSLFGQGLSSASDFVWFGGLKITPDRSIKALNTLVFTVPQTLFQCNVAPGQECLAVYQPTPLGYYNVKVETDKGIVSNTVSYQVTSNGSSATQ